VAWARENATLSSLQERPVRWIVDDCREFVEREAKRGRTYHGILLDPPSYGRGQKKQVWDIGKDLAPLLSACVQILDPKPLFWHLSSHTPGYTPLALGNLLSEFYPTRPSTIERHEMSVAATDSRELPSGAYVAATWYPSLNP
jgi:23S rRNA (cytosine1962-C5)-methyltransferase